MDVNAPKSMTPWLRAEGDGGGEGDEGGEVTGGHPVRVQQELTVGEVATLVGISVRTLHHWDAVGLVRPDGRTTSGYRTYSAADVGRIHRVLVYQELGFSLTRIGELLDDPAVDETAQLHQQRSLLGNRIDRLTQMASAIDHILETRTAGVRLTARQQAEIFGRGWREDWALEAQERWGESDEWAQFQQNARGLSAADRRQVRETGAALYAELAAAKRDGVTPGSDAANQLAEQHRALIGNLFSCTHSMQVCLGQLYVNDSRFSTYFEELESGLSPWLASVINANAIRHGVDPDHARWE